MTSTSYDEKPYASLALADAELAPGDERDEVDLGGIHVAARHVGHSARRRALVDHDCAVRLGLGLDHLEGGDAEAHGVEEVVVNSEVVEGRSQPLVIYSERRDKGGAA